MPRKRNTGRLKGVQGKFYALQGPHAAGEGAALLRGADRANDAGHVSRGASALAASQRDLGAGRWRSECGVPVY